VSSANFFPLSSETGFVGSHVVESFLENGFRVRGTARAASKLENLKQRWNEKYPGKFEVVEVKDILAKDAFHEAIKGKSLSPLLSFLVSVAYLLLSVRL
jgi:nucleoside-diphosphate-sugar epimerase